MGGKKIGHFLEERLEAGTSSIKDLTREDAIYIQLEGFREQARRFWDFYESADIDAEMEARKSNLRDIYTKGGQTREFNALFHEMLVLQEWKDAKNSVKMSGKGREDFAALYTEAQLDVITRHGAQHVADADKGYNDPKEEQRAKWNELLSLPEYKPEFMLQGYDSLANAIIWLNGYSNSHKQAGLQVANCMAEYVEKEREMLPQLDYSDVKGDRRSQNIALFMKLPELTKDQIFAASQACYAFFSRN